MATGLAWTCLAQDEQSFSPNLTISDGKEGRVWKQWRQNVAERPVLYVTIVVHKTSGSSASLKLRFGASSGFENDREVILSDNKQNKITWDVSGAFPKGQPLVLNSYKGEVVVEQVVVVYSREATSGVAKAVSPTGQQCQTKDKVLNIQPGKITRASGSASRLYKITGTIQGTCVVEAGYYENGELKQKINFPLSNSVKTQEFELNVKAGTNGEIRVQTSNGLEESYFVDEGIAGESPRD